MDDESIRNQFQTLHSQSKDYEKRITAVEINQKNLIDSHDDQGSKLDRVDGLLTKITIGGIVLFMAAEKLGLFENLGGGSNV